MRSPIPPQDRIPLVQKLMFAAGLNMDYVATTLMTGILWMPYFNIGLGLSPVVLGCVLMVLRAWDALTDPIMGNISDNARTRWGRRRPFMFVGAITTALLYPLIWHVPESVRAGESWMVAVFEWLPFLGDAGLGAADKATAVYLTLVGMVFFASFTLWSMPYYSLQLEMTPNYDERTRLTAWMALCGKLSSFLGSWILAVVLLVGSLALGDTNVFEGKPGWLADPLRALQPWLADFAAARPDEKPIVIGMRVLCWIIAAGILFFGLLPALFVKERYYEKESSRQSADPFWKSMRESLRCVPLWSLISVSFFLVLGSSSVASLGQYLNFYYVCDGDLAKAALIGGLKGSVTVVAGIAMLPVFTRLAERYDKRTMVLAMLACSMVGHLLNLVFMTPEHPFWQIIPGVFESSAVSAVWLFLPSMKADVADWDERQTSRRREGSINSFYSWFIKASLTASMGIGGVVLQLSGFQAGVDHQPREVLDRMFQIYLLLPLAIWAVALLSIWFYPLTRARSAEIRLALERRRGVI